MKSSAVAAIIILFSLAAAVRAEEIVVKEKVTVNSEQVLMRDVATGPLPEEIARAHLCKAPSYSGTVRLSGNFIAARLRQAGGKSLVVQVPDTVTIERASQIVSWAQIRQAVEDALQSKKEKDLQIEFPNAGKDFPAPPGDLRIEAAIPESFVPAGRQSVPVVIRVGEEYEKTIQADVFIDEPHTVPVARHSIGKGRTITQDDVEHKTLSAKKLRGKNLDDPRLVVGRVAKNAIASGEIIQRRALKVAPVVKRGDVVTLVLETPSISISAFAVVQQEAEAGEIIEVKNLDTGAPVRGKVRDAHTVAVEM